MGRPCASPDAAASLGGAFGAEAGRSGADDVDAGEAGADAAGGDGAGDGDAGGLPMPIFLCGCCASGSTNGPFCPHASRVPARLATTSACRIRMDSSIT